MFGGLWDTWTKRYIGDATTALPLTVSVKSWEIIQGFIKLNTYTEVSGGRGSAKSTTAAVAAVVLAVTIPTGQGMISAPTFEKTGVMWGKLLNQIGVSPLLVPGEAGVKKKDRILIYRTGHQQRFISANKPESGRGWDNDYVIHDEAQATKQESIAAMRFTLRNPGGFREMKIGTPEMGTDFHDEHINFERMRDDEGDDSYQSFHATSYDNPFIPHKIFEDAKKSMDAKYYAQEVMGQWVLIGGRLYSDFDRKIHVKPMLGTRRDITSHVLEEKYGECAEYIIGLDYNAAPMVAIVGKIFDDGRSGLIHWFDECVIKQEADAHDMGELIESKGYSDSVIFDDASGQYSQGGRAPSAILRRQGYKVVHRKRNPKVKDRVASVSAKLKTVDGHVSMLIAPRCKYLIKGLEQQRQNPDGSPDKTQGLDHSTDACGYAVHKVWPIHRLGAKDYQKTVNE